LAFAGQIFGVDIEVFTVKVSFDQKPYRKLMMQAFGAKCHPSPSSLTDFGKGKGIQVLTIITVSKE